MRPVEGVAFSGPAPCPSIRGLWCWIPARSRAARRCSRRGADVRIINHVEFTDSGATIKATNGSVQVTPYSAALQWGAWRPGCSAPRMTSWGLVARAISVVITGNIGTEHRVASSVITSSGALDGFGDRGRRYRHRKQPSRAGYA